MFKIQFKYLLLLLAVALVGCAKRGTITGGLKDTIAPVLKVSLPKNFSTSFKGNEVKLYFDEYIKLKDVNKQLVVSPPMNTPPDIFPNGASKFITIKIKDTLQENTTYSFNFGQSIQDNNEGNPYPQFKYVFSTGDYIDSLSVEGSIKDALEQKAPNFVSVMLYEINEKYNDSVIYKQKPRYITNTLDSLKTWKIENVKSGKYLLIALKEKINNYKFDPKSEKIGFYKEKITVPGTTPFEITLFNEIPAFKILKVAQASGNRAVAGFEGDPREVKVTLKNGATVLPNIVTQMPKKDSLQIWFNKIKTDSLNITFEKDEYVKNYNFKIKDQKKDTLSFSTSVTSILDFRDTFSLTATTPLVKFDNSKITLRNKDSVLVDFTTDYDVLKQELRFNFKKEEEQKYTFQLLPGALEDFFEQKNDSLKYSFTTKPIADYGNFVLKLENVKEYPLIVQLTDEKGAILATEYVESKPIAVFESLKPAVFYLRIIYDTNKNRVWDPGNFLEKRQAEQVLYFPKEIDVRANWDVDQPFDVGG